MGQLSLIEAIEAKERGIQQAIDSAENREIAWGDKVMDLLRVFLSERPTPFRCEEFRLWCEGRIQKPPHDRAYGYVIRKASKAGMIIFCGYDKTENPKAHRANCAKWRGC